jgi:aerobic-type carbon monoxide dehydrogenase small subunit (CoxS/CutS family)
MAMTNLTPIILTINEQKCQVKLIAGEPVLSCLTLAIECEVRGAFARNSCRYGNYERITESVLLAAAIMRGGA